MADSSGVPLQLCLNCDPGDARLQAVRWETLRDLEYNEPLCTHQRVLVSRLLDTADMRALPPAAPTCARWWLWPRPTT